MLKILNLKSATMYEYQNIKAFLQKVTHQISPKKFLWLKKLKILSRGPILLVILTVKRLLERCMKKNHKNESNRV